MAKQNKTPAPDFWGVALAGSGGLEACEINTSAVAYHVAQDGMVGADVVTVTIKSDVDFENDVLGVRAELQRQAKTVPPLSKGAIRDHSMIILFGPNTDPYTAVAGLVNVAESITERGLKTGGELALPWPD